MLKEIRSHKIFGLAIFDLVSSFIGIIVMFLIAWNYHFPHLDWWKFVLAAIVVTMPLSVLFHVLFGVNTQFNYILGLSYNPTKLN